MKPAQRQFARFYYDDFIAEYPAVYADDALLSSWLRLLVIAEKMWPMAPEVPRSVRPRPLSLLIDAGLVAMTGEHCYRIRGLDAERTRRRNAARNAAAQRWQSDGNADAPAEAMPRRDEERRGEIPPPPTSGGRRADRTNPRALGESPRQTSTNPRANGESPRQERQAEKTGPTALRDVMAAIAGGKP